MESNTSIPEDALHRLADAEKLILELRDIISQKDVQLQQKEEALQVLLFDSVAEHVMRNTLA